jgi:protein-tyrosine phosphatase
MSKALPHGNCYRVVPHLVAGEYPGSSNPLAIQARLLRHLDTGITYFLDLTEAHEVTPYSEPLTVLAAARGIQVVHRRLPIRDFGIPRTPAAMVEILDTLDAALADQQTVYLHCLGGIGRTGTVVGCWLVRHGQTGEAALATIAQHWRGVEKASYQPRSPETEEQHTYVRTWHEGAPA